MKEIQPQIRRATQEDVATIAALTNAAYFKYIERIGAKPQPMTTDYAQFVAEHPVWVLPIDQRVVGVLALKHEADALLIFSVAIDPAEQKRGLGRQLLAWAEKQAYQTGYAAIRLYTNEHMIENIALYQRLGYVETRREKLVDRTVVHMRKQLLPMPNSNAKFVGR